MQDSALKDFLDEQVLRYNRPDFIPADPIAIPHHFQKLQDIEIAGFFAAVFAWGQRTTILKKCKELLERMDNAPHQFVMQHQAQDLKRLLDFKHRTFNDTDLLYFVHFFKNYYSQHHSLEDAFARFLQSDSPHVGAALAGFYELFFADADAPARSRKHIATPARQSACKRINMFLRWMVRQDEAGVDFGLWQRISPAQLICPCDVHVLRVAEKLGLLQEAKNSWQTALQLTEKLRSFDKQDPVKYDFALFGLGVMDKL